jgi:hypothetical protein
MGRLEIWVHDHRDGDHQAPGPIIQTWPNSPDDPPGEDYAGWRAHYGAWHKYLEDGNPPELIGFFAYRYYLWDPSWFPLQPHGDNVPPSGAAPGWRKVPRKEFDIYRFFLSTWDGAAIKEQLAHCDILQSAPITVGNGNIITDFERNCGCAHDGHALAVTVQKYGWDKFAGDKIYHWILITHWPIFDRMMREMEPLRLELHDECKGLICSNPHYRKRIMDYVMERVYPLWLLKSGLNFKEIIQLRSD